MKKFFVQGGLGALLGLVLSSAFGPSLIGLLYKPPSGNAFSCAGTVEEALGKFVNFQLMTAAGVGVVVAIGLTVLRKRSEAKEKAVTPATPPT